MSALEEFKGTLVEDMMQAAVRGAEDTFEMVIDGLRQFGEHRAVAIVEAMLVGFRRADNERGKE